MTDTNTPETTATDSTDSTETKPAPAKGSWQEALVKSTTLKGRAADANRRASTLLWDGAQTGITEWLPGADTDAGGEGFYNEVLDLLGKSRKGDASKIRTVALAVKDHGLALAAYPSLSKAYAEAVKITKTVKTEAAEDDAAEEAVAKIAAEAPKSASTPESAAKIVLSKGVDEAARLLLDALGDKNEAAHRSLLRAIANEIAGRKPAPAPKQAKPAGPKAGAKTATKGSTKVAGAGEKAASDKAPAKKAAPKKARPVNTAEVKAAKADAAADTLAAKAEAAGVTPIKRPAVKRATPVKRPAPTA